MDELKLDDMILKLIKVTQDKDLAVAASSRKIEGFDTSTKLSLERINPNIVEHQVPSDGSNFDYYEIKPDKLVRRSDLLESNLNNMYNSNKHEVH